MNGKVLPYKAVLPHNYFADNKSFPVLYLLHGLFGNYENWTTNTELIAYFAEHQFIIVCPDGGDNWYADNQNIKNHFYESYILDELITDVEENFKVKKERKFRAVAGLSMGGYGAFKFAFRRPEMFCFAASTSGAFDVPAFLENKNNRWTELNSSAAEAFADKPVETLKNEDLFYLAENLSDRQIKKLPYFYFDCGNRDSFISINKNFSKVLKKRGITHQFQELSGGHDWIYWNRSIKNIIEFASDYFSR